MALQDLLDLARVDVGAAADDHVLGAVLEGQEAVFVHDPQVAAVQPAAVKRGPRGFRVVPVTEHDRIAAQQHLAQLAGRQGAVLPVRDPDLDHGLGAPDRGEPGLVARVVPVHVLGARERRDGHGALALAVDLHEALAQARHGLLQVLHVHGAAAVNHGLEVAGPGARRLRVLHQSLDHGRRGEHGGARVVRDEREDLRRVELPALGHDLERAHGDMGQVVEARAVGHGGRVHDAVAGRDAVHVGEVAERHGEQVAVREHGALGPPGRAAGVEQPGQIVRAAFDHVDAVAVEERPVLGRRLARLADVDERVERGKVRGPGCDGLGQPVGGEAQARAAVLQDVAELGRVQLGVDRDRRKPGVPAGVEHLDERRAVDHGQRDPLAGAEAEALAQVPGQGRAPAGELAVGAPGRRAQGERRPVPVAGRASVQESGEVHGRTRNRPWHPLFVSVSGSAVNSPRPGLARRRPRCYIIRTVPASFAIGGTA